MASAPLPDSNELLTERVFRSLTESIFNEGLDSLTTERRVWRLPDLVTQFVYRAVTEDDKRRVDPVVHKLRAKAGRLINERIDRSPTKRAIAARIADARSQLTLRSWQLDDATLLASFLDDEQLWQGLPDTFPGRITKQMATELVAIANGWSSRHFVNAIEWRHVPVGQVRLQFDSSPYPDAAEISYWIARPYWGQGLATKAVSMFTADMFAERPQIDCVFAQVLDGNRASMRVLEKAGYRFESFRYQNVLKGDRRYSSHFFGVCRADYDFAFDQVSSQTPDR